MPKYAATLSAAPLQPQKQAPQSNSSQNEAVAVISEKTASKPASTWSDPFTSDGQECKYFHTSFSIITISSLCDIMKHNAL